MTHITTLKACTVCGTPCSGPRCPQHGGNRRALTTHQRGYGWQHQQRRAALLTSAIGTPCPICGNIMRTGDKLDLDHHQPIAFNPTSQGTRITHAHCNRGRR